MVNTVTLRQTGEVNLQRQAGKGKLSGIVKQGGRQIQAISM
jgi:hypothetical protein